MNKNPLTTVLLTILVISALVSVWLCYLCTRNTMNLVKLQQQFAFAQSRGAFVAALAKDVVDYSTKNPAVNPILEAAGIQPPKAATPASAGKPGAK